MMLMIRIIMRMDAQGNGVCFETRANMCEAIGIDKKTWSKKIDKLEAIGLILVQRQHNVPHHISLSDLMKDILRGKNGSLNRLNILDLDRGCIFPLKEDHMDSENPKKNKKRVVRRRRPTNKISDPPLSELDSIHRKFIKKIEKSKASEDEST